MLAARAMRSRLRNALLLTALAAACSSPEPRAGSPYPVPSRPKETPAPDVPPPPAREEAPGEIDRPTRALLERLFAAPSEGAESAAEAMGPVMEDERPLALLAPCELGEGPFAIGGQELPPAAIQYALARALERRFAESGPLRGPALVRSEVLDELAGGETEALEPPFGEAVRSGLGETGARWVLHLRIDRLDSERTTVYLSRSRRYDTAERARLGFSYRLIDLEAKRVAREEHFERTYELAGLEPREKVSIEWVLAWEAARIVRDDLAAAWPPESEGGAASNEEAADSPH